MITFTEALVKGKIAETIFFLMLRNTKYKNNKREYESVFTVLHFGYEHVLPELAKDRYIREKEGNIVLDAIRTAPDFAVVNNQTKEVSLIEVKYRFKHDEYFVLEIAKKMEKSWITAKLFLATPDGFFFDDIKSIIKNKGKMERLFHPNISKEMQQKYLKLLIKYEN